MYLGSNIHINMNVCFRNKQWKRTKKIIKHSYFFSDWENDNCDYFGYSDIFTSICFCFNSIAFNMVHLNVSMFVAHLFSEQIRCIYSSRNKPRPASRKMLRRVRVRVKSVVTLCTHFAQPKCLTVQMNIQVKNQS